MGIAVLNYTLTFKYSFQTGYYYQATTITVPIMENLFGSLLKGVVGATDFEEVGLGIFISKIISSFYILTV